MAPSSRKLDVPNGKTPKPSMVGDEYCTNDFDVPNVLFSIRHLRQNQPRGIAYILDCLKKNPKCTITPSKLSNALKITLRAAELMLHRFMALGYGSTKRWAYFQETPHKLPSDKKIDWYGKLPSNVRYAWSKGQEYFITLHFIPSIEAFKSIFGNFLKNHFSPIVLNNNNSLLSCTQKLVLAARRPNLTREQKRELICKFIKAGRNDLWEYFSCWWSKRDNEPKERENLLKMGHPPDKVENILKQLYPDAWEPDEGRLQSVLSFFISPRIEVASEDLEKVISTMEDLESQRDIWTNKQRGFWFGLKAKHKKLCLLLKELLSSVVRYDQFIKC